MTLCQFAFQDERAYVAGFWLSVVRSDNTHALLKRVVPVGRHKACDVLAAQ